MSAKHYEGKVNGVWASILSHHLPLSEGYVHRPQDKVRKGFSDISSVHWVQRPGKPDLQQCRFLITQCKRPGKEKRGSTWFAAQDQLAKYLRRRPATWDHKTFGIVAIGRWVKFYELNAARKQLLQLGKDRPYHIIEDAEKVVEMLDYIKANHQ